MEVAPMFFIFLLRYLPLFGGQRPLTGANSADEQDVVREARERVGHLRALYVHAAAFAVMTLFAVIVNFVTWLQGGNWWFYWPVIVWAGLLGTHAVIVLGFGGFLGRSWEDRKVSEIVTRELNAGRQRQPAADPAPRGSIEL
jgi:hypothetical protein